VLVYQLGRDHSLQLAIIQNSKAMKTKPSLSEVILNCINYLIVGGAVGVVIHTIGVFIKELDK